MGPGHRVSTKNVEGGVLKYLTPEVSAKNFLIFDNFDSPSKEQL